MVAQQKSKIILPSDINVVWEPLPGRIKDGKYYMSSQELVLTCPCDTIFMSSSRASGKTEVSLIKFCLPIGMGYGPYYRGVYIDMHYKDLADVIARSKRLFPKIYGKKARFYSSKGDEKWVWDTGEELLFRQGATEEDYDRFHGQEYAVILYNELSKNPSPAFFDKMRTTNRTSFNPLEHPYYIDKEYFEKYHIEKHVSEDFPGAEKRYLPPLRPKIIITTNPSGAGKQWVKKRFVDPAPAGKILKTEVTAYNPRTQKNETMVKTQVHIFSSYKENTHLSPEYVLELESIEDPELRKAWLYGDWNCSFGDGMFNDIYRTAIHTVPRFQLPETWSVYCGFDWGWTKPFATLWLAVSDGSPVFLPNQQRFMNTVRGDIFVFEEYYGCVKGKENVGLCMRAVEVSHNIIEKEYACHLERRIVARIADNAIYNSEDGHCIADEMRKPVTIDGMVLPGTSWIGANKKAGSRSVGWELIRNRLANSIPKKDKDGKTMPRELPGLFVCDNCREFLRTFVDLPRDPKKDFDIDTEAEDHMADALRYTVSHLDWGNRSQKTYGML